MTKAEQKRIARVRHIIKPRKWVYYMDIETRTTPEFGVGFYGMMSLVKELGDKFVEKASERPRINPHMTHKFFPVYAYKVRHEG